MNSRKSLVIWSAQLGTTALGALTAVLIARWLGPKNYGLYSYCFGLSAVFSGLGDLGFHQIYLKRIAENDTEDRWTANFLGVKLLLVSAVFICTLLVLLIAHANGHLRGFQPTASVAFLLGSYLLTNLLVLPSSTYFQGRMEMAKASVVSLVQPATLLIFVLMVIPRAPYPATLAVLSLLQPFSAALLIRFGFRRPLWLRPRYDADVLRNYWRYVAPLALSSLAAGAYLYADRFIIKIFLPYASVAYFVVAQRFSVILLLFSSSTMSLLLANMSRAFQQGRTEEIVRIARRATKYLSLITIPAAVFSARYAGTIISFTVGHTYLPAVLILQIFMFRVVTMTYNRSIGFMLNAIEKLKVISLLSVGWYALGVGLDFILIPSVLAGHAVLGLGAAGVALKDIIIDLIAMGCDILLTRKYIQAKFYGRVWRHWVAGAAFWFTATFVNRGLPSPLGQLLAGGACGLLAYCIVLYLLRELGREEWAVIGTTVNPRKFFLYIVQELWLPIRSGF